MHHSATTRSRFLSAFRWFGFGALLIGGTLYGTVSADEVTAKSSEFQLTFLSMGMIGTLIVVVGLLVLFIQFRRLQREEEV